MIEPSFPPHAHPFRMIDVVVEFDRERCSTIKAVTGGEVIRAEPGATGGDYPFALLLETMAQAAIPLSGLPDESLPGGRGRLVGIDGARLLRPVRPGERLLITATIVGRFGGMIRVRSVAELAGSTAGSEIVAEGEFTVALEEGA